MIEGEREKEKCKNGKIATKVMNIHQVEFSIFISNVSSLKGKKEEEGGIEKQKMRQLMKLSNLPGTKYWTT